MRRSVRDAIVGFTVIGGIIGFASTALWLQRSSFRDQAHWTLTAQFNDASGLAERSPVTYRGVLVGSVRSIDSHVLRRWWPSLRSTKVICACRSP